MNNFRIGFIFLILFSFFRPLALINIDFEIGGLNVLELFAIIFSYLLLIAVGLNIRKIKLDLISISIVFFCIYCFISIFWGSQLRTITQVTLPFVTFFAVRIIIKKPEEIKLLLTVLITAYCLLIFGSFFLIIQGKSSILVDSITGIERYAGMFKGIKVLSYAMFFFSVYYYMQVIIYQLREEHIKWILLLLLLISIFCIYKTYARITYLGLITFWTVSLFGHNKKYFLIGLISLFVLVVIYFDTFQQIFFKTPEFDFNIASSGRLILWEHNINLFLESSFDRKLLGHGLGTGSLVVIGGPNEIWSSHNNYIHLLMELGSFGLVMYLIIFILLLKDIYLFSIKKNTKYFYYGIFFSVALMNFFGDVTVYGVGISQQFWMVIGFLYLFRDFSSVSPHSI